MVREEEIMELTEVRREIDCLDQSLREALLRRLDLSEGAVRAKMKSGDTEVFRADREREILETLSAGVEETKKAEYLAVLEKILVTSRMYQYAILCEESAFDAAALLAPGILPVSGASIIVLSVRLRGGQLNQVLGMIGDYRFPIEEVVPGAPRGTEEGGRSGAAAEESGEAAERSGEAAGRSMRAASRSGDAGESSAGRAASYRISFRGDFSDPAVSRLLFQLKNECICVRVVGFS